jgi:hypothetical protein
MAAAAHPPDVSEAGLGEEIENPLRAAQAQEVSALSQERSRAEPLNLPYDALLDDQRMENIGISSRVAND